ncbi:MAG: PcfJ domain-containing protein, partial [Nitratireductor sp.]
RAGADAPAGGRWAGSALADWSWQPSAKEPRARREEYCVRQLSSASELVAETRAMRHCVSTYAAKCIAGTATIWSLTRRVPGKVERLLTIELDRQDRAVQVRGFANRPPLPDEQKVLIRWAKARGVVVT